MGGIIKHWGPSGTALYGLGRGDVSGGCLAEIPDIWDVEHSRSELADHDASHISRHFVGLITLEVRR